jgi:hypothetical protein
MLMTSQKFIDKALDKVTYLNIKRLSQDFLSQEIFTNTPFSLNLAILLGKSMSRTVVLMLFTLLALSSLVMGCSVLAQYS